MNITKTNHSMHGFMLAAVIVAAVLNATSTTRAQNLVPNPGFEEFDICEADEFGVNGPLQWFRTNGTPDYLQSCLPYGHVQGLPMNHFTYQEPYEGASCAGMYTYHHNGPIQYREWIMVPLLEPLVVGQTYYGSFRANAAFGGNAQNPEFWLANDKVGMRFTTMAMPPWNVGDPYPVPPNHAHILYPQILADTVGWTLVSGSFVADSAYQFVMIGQLFSNALTDTLHFAPPGSVSWWYPRAYTVVDAVCVSVSPDGCDLGQGVSEAQVAGPVLFPNPAHDKLVVDQRAGAEAQILDAVGRLLWQGRISNDRWVLDVGSWARGAYMLRMAHRGRVETYKFVLTE
ncbi:MAG: T9SS type A sorting domain-containing protein [Flavobacteriales bacterium]|nr:T9SS type A sorting domain-containing protein [Flavobacteriales bacterium]